jgi:hypothetical protein
MDKLQKASKFIFNLQLSESCKIDMPLFASLLSSAAKGTSAPVLETGVRVSFQLTNYLT